MSKDGKTNEVANGVFLVVGAYGGIGSAVTRRLEESGGRVAVAGRSEAGLANLDALASGGRFTLDARNVDQVEASAAAVVERNGRLDGIVNCVGSLLLKPAHLTRPTEWEETLSTNLGSAFAVVRAAVKTMTSGSVVLVSSAAARIGLANHEAIAAAKAGVNGLTRSAAATYAAKGLRFNAIAPGLVRTPLTERITSNETAARASAGLHAMNRFGEPDEIAGLIAWLLDPRNSWMTGQVLSLDGGLATVRTKTR